MSLMENVYAAIYCLRWNNLCFVVLVAVYPDFLLVKTNLKVGVKAVVQWIRCLPCVRPAHVQSPTSYILP